MRVRPVRSALSKTARFSGVSATVMRLSRSPLPLGLMLRASDEDSIKVTLAASDQRFMARLSAPSTSLPCLIFEGGELSDFESAIFIVLPGHLTLTVELASAYCSV